MIVVSLHPEELLERDARGELSPLERARLERHLEDCAVCRLECRLRSDFRRGVEPLDRDFDVNGLLSRALAPGALAGGLLEPPSLPPRSEAIRKMRPVLLAAAALLVAGASVAAGWKGIPRFRSESGREVLRETSRVDVPLVIKAPQGAPIEVVDVPAPSLPHPAIAAVAPSRATPVVSNPVPVSAVTGSSFGASSRAAAPSPDAAALFAQANAVRRSGDRAGAAELYRALVGRFPRSAEAHEAQAALGRLLLDDGDANAALRRFDEYLSSGGPLEEDVRVDRAVALGRLHRPGEEADAWASFLRAHPVSVHAERARARLRELGER